VLSAWPLLDSERTARELDALIFGVRLERPEPPDTCLAELAAGTLVVELAVSRPPVLRHLLGVERGPLARARAGQGRVLQLLQRGWFDVEQWESVDPHGVIVTVARVR
jgi:hypothetical protein